MDAWKGLVTGGNSYLPAATTDRASFEADVARVVERVTNCTCSGRSCDYCRERADAGP